VSEPGYYRMPSLGADMEVGTVLEWYRGPGDEVHRGDLVALIDTEKAEIEAEIFQDGTIGELLVEVGVTVPVGTPLATVVPVGSQAAAAAATATATAPAALATAVAPAPSPPAEPSAPAAVRPIPPAPATVPRRGDRVIASPLARRLARDRGIELADVSGSGPGGAVHATDLDSGPTAVAAGVERTSPRREPAGDADPRRAIARLMARSKREIPHYYLAHDIDLEPALRWLAAENETRPLAARILPAALLVRAVAVAARAVPELNGHWVDDRFQPATTVDVGVAITRRGSPLTAPAILGADRLDVGATMAALRDLVARARRGGLRASEMAAPSITVTNLGDGGVDVVYGVIYPPQVAMVGFGRIAERAWASDGMVGARRVVTATLAADHRATDGHTGARFLGAVAHALADPERLQTTEEDR